MSTITFDTLKFSKTLEKAGVPVAQAEAIAEAFKDASGEAEVATKRPASAGLVHWGLFVQANSSRRSMRSIRSRSLSTLWRSWITSA